MKREFTAQDYSFISKGLFLHDVLFVGTCTGGLWSVVVAVLLGVGEPCFMMVVGVTCRAIRGVPGACRYAEIRQTSVRRVLQILTS